MQRTRVYVALLAVLPLALAGCKHGVWGNMTALGMTLGLFFGTLQLGRRQTVASDARSLPPSSTK